MPYVKRTTAFTRFRILISGLSNTGKTTSLPTFIYGPYDHHDPEQQTDAETYAAGKHMVILVCPGETGYRSLPLDTENLSCHYIETTDSEESTSAEWSAHHVNEFITLSQEIRRNKPDILIWDGLHWFYNHLLNSNSNGEFLAGVDMNVNPSTGQDVAYRASRFYNRTRHNFGQYLADYYSSTIPIFGCTVWERWEEVSKESDRADIRKTRYLWPDIPGEMATRVVGLFDARVSARVESRCLVSNCAYAEVVNRRTKETRKAEHHVWQFLSRDDVMGVGIKGLRVNKAMQRDPWIHQNWDDLQRLIATFS